MTLAYDPVVPGYAVTPVPVDFMISARNQAIADAKTAEADFLAKATAAGVSHESRMVEVMSGGGLDDIIHEVRLADLVVIGEDDPDRPEPVREALIESVLFHAGAPLLLVPRKAPATIDPRACRHRLGRLDHRLARRPLLARLPAGGGERSTSSSSTTARNCRPASASPPISSAMASP